MDGWMCAYMNLCVCVRMQARVYSESTSEVDLSALKRQIVSVPMQTEGTVCLRGLLLVMSCFPLLTRPDTEMLGILDYLSVAMTSPTFSVAPSSTGCFV